MTEDRVIAALNQHFQERRERVPVLRQRAADEGITEISRLEDIVPLLFPHTVYKSYPAQLLDHGRWAQMNRWLSSVSTVPVEADMTGVTDVDGWLARMAEAEIYVSNSSGTTGKTSFLNKSYADLETSARSQIVALTSAGVLSDNSWNVVTLAPVQTNALSKYMGDVLVEKFARPDTLALYPMPMQTEGHHAYMTRVHRLRRALVEGTASPEEVAAVEVEQKKRQKTTEDLLNYYADRVLERPSEPMLFGTFVALAWRFVEVLRARGVKPGDITGPNAIFMAGGSKGAVLPPDHEEQISAMLNISPEHFVQLYSMQEINLAMPRCVARRYHVPDELVLLVLDEPGEKLASVAGGKVEGRAAFFDLTMDARWGGTISGDHIRVDLGTCACGRPGPAIHPDIARYANKTDGDKITCAGSMDAYVRGIIAE